MDGPANALIKRQAAENLRRSQPAVLVTASVAHVAYSSDKAVAPKSEYKEISTVETIQNHITNNRSSRQWQWILTALTALLVLVAFLSATGCSPPHH